VGGGGDAPGGAADAHPDAEAPHAKRAKTTGEAAAAAAPPAVDDLEALLAAKKRALLAALEAKTAP
jgi:hypothetical protein